MIMFSLETMFRFKYISKIKLLVYVNLEALLFLIIPYVPPPPALAWKNFETPPLPAANHHQYYNAAGEMSSGFIRGSLQW